MDLVAGVRKEGSRGGRDSFKWTDVQQSQHRENYLGHSLMAPVGRWQKGRDLQWYAKAEDEDAEKARIEREEELRRVKEAEEEAIARALGLPVAPKSTNANLTPLGGVIAAAAMIDAATEVATATERETGNGDITGIIVMIENITAMNDDTGRDLYREIEIIVGGRDPVKGAEKAEVPVLTISIVSQEEVTPQMMIVDLIDEVAEIEVTAGDIDVNPCIFMLLTIIGGVDGLGYN
ncbi:hypothetical protein Plec18167_000821 [Paecilomyces lecythidis]|uniref:Multiple myeloma tumor-associated protein 2-like N-terminal domain-containing protein n=1 Tax=Paecilomyces lecythidis TaxID=3004212 RepID=A0ABR3YGK8_9EURO